MSVRLKLCLTVVGVMAATMASGQAGSLAPQDMPARKSAFDVVSVRLAKPNCSLSMAGPSHGRYRARCVTLWTLIFNSLDVQSFQDYPPGLPGWADKDKFDIEATADDDTTAAMEKLLGPEQAGRGREMLLSLLADRFRLRVHYESRMQPIYELVVTKGGFRLKPLPSDRKPGGISAGPGEMIAHGTPIAVFAHFLSVSGQAGRIVVDKTGVSGNYDIDLKWTPDDRQGTADSGPTLFAALEEQLGLKLQAAKGPVDALVVDHVEKPSEN
jgi:uncharacterized protein (TIGR03435 family)